MSSWLNDKSREQTTGGSRPLDRGSFSVAADRSRFQIELGFASAGLGLVGSNEAEAPLMRWNKNLAL